MIFDIYTRVSDEGDRSGPSFGSPEEQEAAARSWIQKQPNAEVGEVVYEGNVSGGTAADDRQLGSLIRRVERGESNGIVVLYEDRFARDVIEGGRALRRIVEAGGRLIATATGFDSDNLNPQSQMLFNIMMAVGQAQRERNRDNYITGKERAVARGVYGASAPFGYDRDEEGRLQPNDHAETVREIFRLRAEGIGFSEISRRIKNAVTRSGVRRIVMNRAYLGEQRIPNPQRPREPKVIRDSHAPLVTSAEWEAANAVKGRAPIRRGLSASVALKGIVKCGRCMRPMSVLSYGPKREKLTYACTRTGCGAASMAVEKVEPAVRGAVYDAIMSNEHHVAATLADDDRYEAAMETVEQAQTALADYRDNIELQQVLGIKDFAAGLRARRESLEVARRALRDTPRPAPITGKTADDLLQVRRVVADVLVFPKAERVRLAIRWHGAEDFHEVTPPQGKASAVSQAA